MSGDDGSCTFSVPPSSSVPFTSTVNGVTLEGVMAQLQRMDARLNYLTDEMCQTNTQVGSIARWQARMAGFAPSPSPSLEASANEDDASSSSDDGIMAFQWLAICHSWQKGGSSFRFKGSLVLRGRISIGHIR